MRRSPGDRAQAAARYRGAAARLAARRLGNDGGRIGARGRPAAIAVPRRTGGRSIVVASPAETLRARLRAALKGLEVHAVDDGAGLARTVAEVRPTVVFFDLELPGLGGLDGVSRMQKLHPAARLIALADAPDVGEGMLALLAGVRGYCDKNISARLIRKARTVVLRGEMWITRNVVPLLLKRLTESVRRHRDDSTAPLPSAFAALAPRERQIAKLVGGGASNKEIAHRLDVTEATVKAHLTSVYRKLNVSDRLRLALVVSGRHH
jgi:DNA-binding NarL/FixJ family response regulator